MILAIAVAAASADADRFDLVCSGKETTQSVYENKTEQYTTRYRLDLIAGKWCSDECKAPAPFKSVEPTMILFSYARVDAPGEKSFSQDAVDRETGRHSMVASFSNPRDRLAGLLVKAEGQCQKETFSGFPKFETKF